jgi:hypothetical protein
MIELDEKIRRKDVASQMADESYVGLLAFTIKELEKSGVQAGTKTLPEMAKVLLHRGPQGLAKVLELYVDFHLKERSERWDWDRWESHDHLSGHAFMSRTDEFIGRAFALLILQSCGQSDREFLPHVDEIARKARRAAYLFKQDRDGLWRFIDLMQKELNTFGITVEDQNVGKLRERTELIRKEAEELLAKDVAAQNLETNKVEQFRFSFETSYLENAKFREIFSSAPQDFREQSERWGIDTWLDREMFVASPIVHFTDFGRTFGKDLGSAEDGYVFSLLRDSGERFAKGIVSGVEHLLGRGVRPEDIVILASRDQEIFTWLKDVKYVPGHLMRHKILGVDGEILVGTDSYPVFNVWIPEQEQDAVLIVAKSEVEILFRNPDAIDRRQVVCDSLEFSVVDPSQYNDLKEKLIEENPDWLAEFDDKVRPQLVGLKVWLRILQYRQASIKEPGSVLVIPLENIPESGK